MTVDKKITVETRKSEEQEKGCLIYSVIENILVKDDRSSFIATDMKI